VDMVLAERPDAVIVATGGLPNVETLEEGRDLVISAWDIISGDVKPGSNVLIYDDAGDHAGLQAAEVIVKAGGKVEIMTRDRAFAPEVMAMNLVPYMRELQKRDATFTVTYLVEAVKKSGNQLLAVIGSDYGGVSKEQLHDQVIVNYGTKPSEELYFELKPLAANRGAVNYERLVNGQPQQTAQGFQLYRIGDAVAARNTHAAIYDANRLVRTI